jgi:hypothetical protein
MPQTTIETRSGRCLCGAVRFEYTGEIGGHWGKVTVCHCSMCRRAQGYASAVAPIAAAGLRWLQGEGLITEYASTPGKLRAFCTVCGSPLYSRRTDRPDLLRLRLGTFDQSADVCLDAHIFCAGLPPWAEVDNAAPRFSEFEPGR